MEYKTLKEFCTITKGKTGIMKAIPGKFPLVVTSEERKTHNEFQFEGKAVIVPLVSGTGHGHASIKRIHYQEGKFALGTILCAIIPKNEKVLNAQFLYHYLNLVKEKELVGRMKGMANVTLPIKEIEKVPVPILTIEEQLKFVEFYTSLKNDCNTINTELTHQLDLISQLRQAFLKEAMQGKLVSNETSDGKTGADLLAEIQTEKEKLIKEKKIKKQKPLPPISEEEIPFDIPENWVWCRLGEVSKLKSGNQYRYDVVDFGVPYVKVGDMNLVENYFSIETSSTFFDKTKVNKNDLIEVNSIIFPKRGGAIATNKKRVVLKKEILIDSNTMSILPNEKLFFDFFYWNFKMIDLSKLGKEGVIPQVNNQDIEPYLFPLPPFEIQNRIVSKLEELMTYCDDLETSVKESQNYNEQLLQQVLREALEVKKVAGEVK